MTSNRLQAEVMAVRANAELYSKLANSYAPTEPQWYRYNERAEQYMAKLAELEKKQWELWHKEQEDGTQV
jgi:hypothetical protein